MSGARSPRATCSSSRSERAGAGGASMIGRLNHVAIAVRDLKAASRVYRDMLGASLSAPPPQPEHGVPVVFIIPPNPRVDLLEPLGEGSPIASFLERSPEGGIHHVCYEVDDIRAARDRLVAAGAPGLRGGGARNGGDGEPGVFPPPQKLFGAPPSPRQGRGGGSPRIGPQPHPARGHA